jgi:hypothetical protein
MTTIADHIAAMFGEGPDVSGAYGAGQLTGARTQEALERARRERNINLARANYQALENPMDFSNPELTRSSVLGGLGGDVSAVELARQRNQEFNTRDQLQDPNLPGAEAYALERSLRPTRRFHSVGSHGYYDAGAETPSVELLPTGDAYIERQKALAARPPASEPMIAVVGEDGGAELIPRSAAQGRQPAPTGRPPATAREQAAAALARNLGKDWLLLEEEEREELLSAMDALMMSSMGSGGTPEPLEQEQDDDVPAELPRGSRFFGTTLDGKRVYQLPDGSKVVEE